MESTTLHWRETQGAAGKGGWCPREDSMARAVSRSVRRVRPSGSFLDQSRRWAGFRQVWRQPRFLSRALVAVATRWWRKRMSARASANERGSGVGGVFMAYCFPCGGTRDPVREKKGA